ncbi:diguanylate cyclase (GGDEF)-like protein/PAS domain S-box-containing protein [Halomonas fontilapidosi]|uniref:Diguanylate cyclase (GGDEF)-like protein/PAS domain S-box-containing protein n=1 Tax=Halomonas fontilapidosi TaxID=616675 RepID=A0A7W5GXW3_9GAMM|nr:PhnD/SsuA/transferrin family substrate-binding protein [Halomonas fontilapidosi]MBB3182839.1 diguanylate cyclase (GGDEF)-like protein/PAS domain S-box-containing protein [Halomonas fontilapidosi]
MRSLARHWLAVLLAVSVSTVPPAQAGDSLVLGIFAYRDPAVMQARYQPLADYLDAQLPDTRVSLETLGLDAIERAISHRRVDLLMTNPSHYLLVRSRNSLTGALATQIRLAHGQEVSSLGGVIITRANRDDISELGDLKGQRVGIPGKRFLGGYQTQAYELQQAGLSPSRDIDTLELGSHDAVVSAVAAGRVDVGFVRTGVLESLAREGRIDLDRLKVVNAQQLSGFPYVISTRLYPEWPLMALPQVERAIVQRISSALFALTPDHEVAQAAGIAGFAPPMDYLPVEKLARQLRLPPFDQSPDVTWQDIWEQQRPYLLALLGALLIVLLLLAQLSRRNRKLKRQREQMRLAASVFDHTHEGIMITSPDGRIIAVNPAFTTITGYDRQDVIGHNANLLGLGRHEPAFFFDLWQALQENGYWFGEIWNRRKCGRDYAQRLTISAVRDDHGQVKRYVGLMEDITSVKAHQQELEYIAHYDALTGLPNRVLLADRIHQAMASARRHQHRLALVFIDLDGFKAVNDVHGHDMGDRLLVELSQRMQAALRESDTLGRLGGDEFVAVLGDLESTEACRVVLKRLLSVVATPMELNGVKLQVSASMGVAFSPPGQELDADQLLRHADQAMYRAKELGKNRYAYFEPELEDSGASLPEQAACDC